MMRQLSRIFATTWITIVAAALISGCNRNDSTTSTPPSSGVGTNSKFPGKEITGAPPGSETGANPGGAPTFGSASGMGFSTGDAAHSGGQGGGLMGYNNTGAAGTSGAITDARVNLLDESRGVIVEPPNLAPTTEPSAEH